MTSGPGLGDRLNQMLTEIRALRRAIDNEDTVKISKAAFRDRAHDLAEQWRLGFRKELDRHSAFSAELLKTYNELFDKLLQLSLGPSRRTTYLSVLGDLARSFRKDLVLPAHTAVSDEAEPTAWEGFLRDLPVGIEGEYFREALECAQEELFRAAAVMGWCACVDQIQRKVVAIGLGTFNKTSEKIAGQTKGRFKRFNKKFSVDSLSELRAQVFDEDLLIVVEAMGLIDNNQFRRLRTCLEMRNQAAHPGEAPITQYNLMSFFSDVVEMVLKNENFTH
jgi:hypothetical protein